MARSSRKNSTHRPQKDTNTKAQRELKQENRNLKRQLARVQKDLAIAEQHAIYDPEPIAEEIDVETIGATCEHCGSSDLLEFKLPHKTVVKCKSCRR